MAGGALFDEERLAVAGVADDDGVGPIAGTVVAVDAEAVEVGREVGGLGGGEIVLGHHGAFDALAQYGGEFFALVIVQYDLGADEVGSHVAASGVLAVAEAAFGGEESFAAIDLVGGGEGALGIGGSSGSTGGQGGGGSDGRAGSWLFGLVLILAGVLRAGGGGRKGQDSGRGEGGSE